jgi:hypothetical protein
MSFHTEARLLSAIASAPTLAEQSRLVEELQALRAARTAQVKQANDIEWADTVVTETLSPVATHVFHTAATDWMQDVAPVASEGAHQEMMAEAAAWFQRTSSFVKSDEDEFAEQAIGMARRLSGKYGEEAPAAAQSFLDYAAFLHSREAASGLDQVQQTTAPDGVSTRPTQLPVEVFDNFAPPVNEFNQGVDEAQTSDHSQNLAEMVNGAGGKDLSAGGPGTAGGTVSPGGGKPSEHSTGNDLSGHYGPPSVLASREDADVAPFGSTSPALNYVASLDDFRAVFAAEAAAKDDEAVVDCKDCGSKFSGEGSRCADCAKKAPKPAKKAGYEVVSRWGRNPKAAASGLDQITQTTAPDGVTEKPTPLPGDVAFELTPAFQGEESTQGQAAPGAEHQSTAALEKEADMFGNSDEPHAVPGSQRDGYNEETNASPKKAERAEGEKDVPASLSRDFSNDNTHDFNVKSSKDYTKAFKFAQNWKEGDRLVSTGSAEFETGIFEGLTDDNRTAFLAAHVEQAAKYPVLGERIVTHAVLGAHLAKTAGTDTDLDTLSPTTYPDPQGRTPINGPGDTPPLAGGMDAAAPGGPAPYNGVEPLGSSVVPGVDQKPNTPKPGGEQPPVPQDHGVGPQATESGTGMGPQTLAFRKTCQANLLAETVEN